MRLVLLLLVSLSVAFAQTPYTLSKFQSIYPIVEIYTDKVPASYKQEILTILKEYTDEMGINTKGFSDRALGFLITRVAVGEKLILKVELLVGEDVKRLDDGEETFALTYQKIDIFEVNNLEEDLIDSVEYLLEEFKEQYKEDNE